MRSWLTRRPSPAMAIAFVALLAALSGTAVALPGRNTVDSGDIVNKQVKRADIANKAVTGKKVKNSSLTGADVKADSLTGADVAEGTLGKVASASSADTANSANTANSATTAGNATHATRADSAQPVAFAEIDGTAGTVVAAASKGVTNANITHPNTGVICISGLAFDIKGGAVNTVFTGANSFAQFTESATGFCPNGGQVLTKDTAGTLINQTFHVVLYG